MLVRGGGILRLVVVVGRRWSSLATVERPRTAQGRPEIAKRAGLTQRAFRHHARVSFAKVAEYQKRGAVHFHAVIRFDGPEGGDTAPPAWGLRRAADRRPRRPR
ncbi:predicted protein [Streptomyces viridochromogenes DSM 40736]|uniref:Predicted protein n=1 Tax=Streptomyces viridochromogenes (strain DSM 40736 / JCM 4977 / BCRC 1201 / Tue 494) TaxID=591159 RepID=D9X2H5_STRVT|nr:predicted protein [Streptomyces viridochromogenes DSM 40736]